MAISGRPLSSSSRAPASTSEKATISNWPVASDIWMKAKRLPRAEVRSCRPETTPARLTRVPAAVVRK